MAQATTDARNVHHAYSTLQQLCTPHEFAEAAKRVFLQSKTKNDFQQLTRFASLTSPTQKGTATPLHGACRQGQIDLVAQLILNGADPTAGDEEGHPPAHYL
ncbi:MAG: hypothetical protein AB7F31_05685 [Parachlamydiales bacterium]